MSKDKGSLKELLVSEEDINEELIVDIVSPYLKIGEESGSLIRQPKYEELTAKLKVALVLISQKAKKELGMVDKEFLTPSDISEIIGLKKGTIYPNVRKLEEEGIAKSDDGEYYIPNYNLERVKKYLEEEIQ